MFTRAHAAALASKAAREAKDAVSHSVQAANLAADANRDIQEITQGQRRSSSSRGSGRRSGGRSRSSGGTRYSQRARAAASAAQKRVQPPRGASTANRRATAAPVRRRRRGAPTRVARARQPRRGAGGARGPYRKRHGKQNTVAIPALKRLMREASGGFRLSKTAAVELQVLAREYLHNIAVRAHNKLLRDKRSRVMSWIMFDAISERDADANRNNAVLTTAR